MLTDLTRYEAPARQYILDKPGYSTPWVTLSLHRDDDGFWQQLARLLSSCNHSGDLIAETVDQSFRLEPDAALYAEELLALARKDASWLVRLKACLDATGTRVSVPDYSLRGETAGHSLSTREGEVTLHSLLENTGRGGQAVWFRLIRHFCKATKVDATQLIHYFGFADEDQARCVMDAVDWIDGMNKGRCREINDESMYLALVHEVAEMAGCFESSRPWFSHLDKIPQVMRRHSSLGLLLIFEKAQTWIDRGIILADRQILLRPCGRIANGVIPLFWNRPYHCYDKNMDANLKRNYVEAIPAGEVIAKVIERGAGRISPSAQSYLAAYIERHPGELYKTAVAVNDFKDLARIGVSKKTLLAHPHLDAATKRLWLGDDLGL